MTQTSAPRPLRVLLAGTPANAAQVFRALARTAEAHPERLQIAGVLTMPDAPVGRKRVLSPTATAQLAEELEVPLVKAAKLDDTVREQIAALEADLAVVVAYGAMLRTPDLALLPLGWYNLHYSLLPRWRGAAPVQRSIMADERQSGLTVFRIDEGLDTGPIAFSSTTAITALDDTPALLQRLSDEGSEEISSWLLALAMQGAHTDDDTRRAFLASLTEQPAGEFPYAAKLDAESGHCTPQMSAAQISALARGLAPHPSAWMLLEDPKSGERQKLKIHQVGLPQPYEPEEEPAEPGEVRLRAKRVFLACQDQWLELKQVQPFGKKAMPAADWLRGQANHQNPGQKAVLHG